MPRPRESIPVDAVEKLIAERQANIEKGERALQVERAALLMLQSLLTGEPAKPRAKRDANGAQMVKDGSMVARVIAAIQAAGKPLQVDEIAGALGIPTSAQNRGRINNRMRGKTTIFIECSKNVWGLITLGHSKLNGEAPPAASPRLVQPMGVS